MKRTVVHTINLHETGGVQNAFVDYYETVFGKSAYDHLVYGLYYDRRIYGKISTYKSLKENPAHCVSYLKYLYSRDYIMHYYNMLSAPKLRVLLSMCHKARILFHERGGVWNATEKNIPVCRTNAKHADILLANSKATKIMLMKKIGVEPERIKVVYNGIRQGIVDPGIVRSVENNDKTVVGFIGRFEGYKGAHVLIDAMKRIQMEESIVCRIAGSGPLEDHLRKRARGIETIDFVGIVRDPISFISECDIIVVPSIREPFGNVIVEAGFCKRPVIATEIDGIPEIITDKEKGILIVPTCPCSVPHARLNPTCVVNPRTEELVNPSEIDPDELAGAILRLTKNRNLQQSLGHNLYSWVVEAFKIETYISKLEAIYNSL